MQPETKDLAAEIRRLERKLEREKATRLEAESISEKGLRNLYERQQEIQLLAKIADASNNAKSLVEVLQFTATQICEFTGWEVGHTYLPHDTEGGIRLRSTAMWHTSDSDRIADFRRVTEEMDFAPGIGLPGRAFSGGKPLWILDVTADENFPRQPFALKCGLRSASAFPVFSGNEVVAVLEFFASHAREPSENLLDLMSQIGLQLGRVIERQRAEDALRKWTEELTRARDEAKSADIAKSAFLTTMSHELRTPLNAIIGFSEMMSSEIFGKLGHARYHEYAGHIFSSGTHLLGLINEILDISKLDAGYLELLDETIDLEKLLTGCIETVAPLAQKAGLRLSLDCEPVLPALRGDQKRLRQILLNLISNAIKFTPEAGEVRISASCSNGIPIVRVRDTGIGMAPEDIPRALERFGQIDSTLARKYEGTGLGLPLAKKLTELHGGRLEIDSMIGMGTTVSVILPAERVIAAAAA